MTSSRILPKAPLLFFATLCVALAVGFVWLGLNRYRSNQSLESNRVVATATVTGYDGSFLRGQRQKQEVHNYRVEYDGHRYHFQWTERYGVDERFQVEYDRTRPSTLRILKTRNKSAAREYFSAAVLPVLFLAMAACARAFRGST